MLKAEAVKLIKASVDPNIKFKEKLTDLFSTVLP